MNWPPALMRMKVHNRERKFSLWLPLFLVIPLILAVLIVLSPLFFIAVLVLWPSGWGKTVLLAPWAACRIFCATRGLRVDVQGPREVVKIYFV